MPSADVYLFGQKYTIKGEESAERILDLSRFIEAKVDEVCKQYPDINPTRALILTLFNMAEELHALKFESQALGQSLESKADQLNRLLE